MDMQKIKISADIHDDDHRRLVKIRKHLHAYSSVGINPENPAYAIHRDKEGRAYFQLSTNKVKEVDRVLAELGHTAYARVEAAEGIAAEPCLRCGLIVEGPPPAKCKDCGFQETSPCPHCSRDVSRASYRSGEGGLLRCPSCNGAVILHFNEPLFKPDGDYNEPVIVVELIADAAE
jgi:DNA-directed RNA polymerase subunit RPC12/RpoP